MSDLRLDYLRRLAELQLGKRERDAERSRRYLYDPAGWARDFVHHPQGGGLTHYQERILGALAEHRRVAVRGPHGLGKSFSAAMAVLWFANTRDQQQWDWKVVITASAWRQISGFLFPEVRRWARRLNWAALGRDPYDERRELQELGLKLHHGAVLTAASSDPAKLEGAHSDSLLVVFDEAKAIPPSTWDAIEGAFSGGRNTGLPEAFALALSTPGDAAGRFYEIHQRRPGLGDWHPIHVTLNDAIQAGRISPEWAEQRKRQWGENSALYQRRVLGNFHADDDDAVIPLDWIEAATQRWHDWQRAGFPPVEGPQWTGVDVGRGGDSSVLARRTGHAVTLVVKNVRDTMAVADLCALEPGRCIVDVIGVGAGVYDRLKQMGRKPVPYAGSGKSPLRDRSRQFGAFNVRSAAYWHLRELLDPEYEPTIALPPDDLLLSDLTTPRWEVTAGVPPKIKVETKESVVERLGRSPDRGDAVAAAFYADAVHTPTQVIKPIGFMPHTSLSPLG